MSDSESSQQIEVKAELQLQAKTKELIQRGKEITPFYDENTLYNIYKESYSNENVFLNKLEIIVKTRRLQEEDKDGWIQSKNVNKSNVSKYRQDSKFQSRERYNFLLDKNLIERAKNFNNQENLKQRQNKNKYHQQYKQQSQYYPKEDSKTTQYQSRQNNDYNQKKLKYKEKVDHFANNSRSDITDGKKAKYVERKYEQKKNNEEKYNRYQQKNGQKKNKYEQKNNDKKIKYQQKKQQEKIQSNNHQQEINNKTQNHEKKQSNHPTTQTITQNKQNPQPQSQPQVQTLNPQTQQKKQESKAEKVIISQLKKSQSEIVSQSRISSEKKIPYQIPPQVQKQFQNTIAKNSLVLKFIKPSAGIQKISYIRDPNGNYKDVKTRQIISSNY